MCCSSLSDHDTASAWKGSPETASGLHLDNLGGTLNAEGVGCIQRVLGSRTAPHGQRGSSSVPHHD